MTGNFAYLVNHVPRKIRLLLRFVLESWFTRSAKLLLYEASSISAEYATLTWLKYPYPSVIIFDTCSQLKVEFITSLVNSRLFISRLGNLLNYCLLKVIKNIFKRNIQTDTFSQIRWRNFEDLCWYKYFLNNFKNPIFSFCMFFFFVVVS